MRLDLVNLPAALVALRGELDLVSISKVADVIERLQPQPHGVRHIVLDLRGLSFIDLPALRELMKQNEFARAIRLRTYEVRVEDDEIKVAL